MVTLVKRMELRYRTKKNLTKNKHVWLHVYETKWEQIF